MLCLVLDFYQGLFFICAAFPVSIFPGENLKEIYLTQMEQTCLSWLQFYFCIYQDKANLI